MLGILFLDYGSLVRAIEVGASLFTSGFVLWLSRKLQPLFRRQNDMLRSVQIANIERDAANLRADLEKKSAKAWQDRFDSINGSIDEMRAEFNEKIARMERKQDLAVRYICELIKWGHDRRRTDPMPEPPDELRAEVDGALETHHNLLPTPE